MTRADLEAAIWRVWPSGRSALADEIRVEAILKAADQYATYTGGVTAARRAEIAASAATRKRDQRATSGRVHRRDAHYSTKTACGLATVTHLVTFDKDAVTCRRCNPWAEAS